MSLSGYIFGLHSAQMKQEYVKFTIIVFVQFLVVHWYYSHAVLPFYSLLITEDLCRGEENNTIVFSSQNSQATLCLGICFSPLSSSALRSILLCSHKADWAGYK